ncbi:hypothetical protein M2447_001754 [Ereboglobus sp. PH5-10]|nr:hypothetical protein [Ereboglobus sp. PH5-10]
MPHAANRAAIRHAPPLDTRQQRGIKRVTL